MLGIPVAEWANGTRDLALGNGAGSGPTHLRRVGFSALSSVEALLPGRRHLQRGEDTSGSDSEGEEGEEPAASVLRTAEPLSSPGSAASGSRKRPLASAAAPVACSDDVIYIRTERVFLSQTFLTSWLVKKRSRMSVSYQYIDVPASCSCLLA